MDRKWWLRSLLLTCLVGASSCTFYSTAKRWHGKVGADGEPVYYTSATKVGLHLLIVVPFLGDMGIEGMVDKLTGKVAEQDGDYISIVQGETEAYWYGWPPFTWIITPVVSTVTAEYRPSSAALLADEAERNSEGDALLDFD